MSVPYLGGGRDSDSDINDLEDAWNAEDLVNDPDLSADLIQETFGPGDTDDSDND